MKDYAVGICLLRVLAFEFIEEKEEWSKMS
jgi:hypothetical protein